MFLEENPLRERLKMDLVGFKKNSIYFNQLRLQFFLGLLLFTPLLKSQEIDSLLWDSIRKLNLHSYNLSYSNLDSAEEINIKLYDAVRNPIDSLIMSDVYSASGTIYFNKGLFDKSLHFNLEALKLRNGIRDLKKISTSQNNIGNVYYYTNALDKALEYYSKSIQNIRMVKAPSYEFAGRFNSIGLIYLEKEKYD